MPHPSSRVLLGAGALGAAALIGVSATGRAASSAPAPLTFAPKIVLAGDPKDLVGLGGEPSIQDDGHGHLYVTSPTGLATALANGTGLLAINHATGGGTLWRSLDGGLSFGGPQFFGNQNGGGDTDVTADTKQNVYVADLEAVASDVQKSTDHAATFSAPVQTAPDDDREWLTPVGSKLFITYHDFAVNVDLIFVSTDGGATFTPAGVAGKIVDPTDNPQAAGDCFNGNLISKPVTDAGGALYILLNCSNLPNNLKPTGAALDRLYLAVSRDGGSSFKTTLVSDLSNGGTDPGTWGHVFNQLAIDAGGNLYVAASGNLKGSDPVHTFLIRSLDNGKTWQAPINLNAATPTKSEVFPAVAVGQAGQVAVGYYGTTTCRTGTTCNPADYRGDGNIFQFYISQTLDATAASPTFTTTQVTTDTPHEDGICTDGIFCGTPLSAGGNRNLADFESMTVDPAGHIELIIPADPPVGTATTSPTVNWFFRETGGPLTPPGATNGNGTGNQTYITTAAAATASASPTPTATATAASTAGAAAAVGSTPNTGRAGLAGGGLAAVVVVAVLVTTSRARRRRRP